MTNIPDELMNISQEAASGAAEAIQEAQTCTENPYTAVFCLGNLAFKTQIQAAGLSFRSAYLITRLGISIPTIPQALQLCIATRIAEAALSSAKIVFDIASCTASGVMAG